MSVILNKSKTISSNILFNPFHKSRANLFDLKLTFVPMFQSLLNRTSHAERRSSRRCLDQISIEFIRKKIVHDKCLGSAYIFVRFGVLETAKQKLLHYCVISGHSDSLWIHFEREISSALLPDSI